MVCIFHCAHSHLEMQLNDILIVPVMVLDACTVANTDPIPPKMADTDLSIWHRCIPTVYLSEQTGAQQPVHASNEQYKYFEVLPWKCYMYSRDGRQ